MTLENLPIPLGEQMRKNRYRTAYLFMVFPLIIIGLTYIGLLLAVFFSSDGTAAEISPLQLANELMSTVGFWVLIGVFIYSLISYYAGSKMLLAFAGAKPIKKSEYPELYRVVENASIAAGLPKTPNIHVIKDSSMNAFATGRDPKHATVAISTGLLEKLDKAELEGVMAHEIGHILNRDIRVMMLSITLVGAIEMIGEVIIRIGVGSRESKNPLFFVGILFLTVGVVLGLITRMAISREREYLADSTSAHLTSNPGALASALRKIAGDARIEALDGKSSMAGLCIADPTETGHQKHSMALGGNKKPRSGIVAFWHNVWSTHPPIDDRIARLEQY